MSPCIHRLLFSFRNENVSYEAYDIAPEALENHIPFLKTLDGFNITIPHKQAIIPFLNILDEEAGRQGSVNTVRGQDFSGHTTDALGFSGSLAALSIPLSGSMLCLGYGGVARTVCHEALKQGGQVTIAARTQSLSSARALAEELFMCYNTKVNVTDITNITGRFDILFNGTPVGMYPHPDALPVEETVLDCVSVVFDSVYNPGETRLLQTAKTMGKTAVGGMSMLVRQAAAAHFVWDKVTYSEEQIQYVCQQAQEEMGRMFP